MSGKRNRLNEEIKNRLKEIYAQRDEILEAFIAKYGFEPDECEQVIQYTEDSIIFSIRRRIKGD
jgi:hypothetical protein